MLVLSRRHGERIRIGQDTLIQIKSSIGEVLMISIETPAIVGECFQISEDVSISFLSSADGVVRIGVQAPRNIAVNREEVHQRIKRERKTKDSGPAK